MRNVPATGMHFRSRSGERSVALTTKAVAPTTGGRLARAKKREKARYAALDLLQIQWSRQFPRCRGLAANASRGMYDGAIERPRPRRPPNSPRLSPCVAMDPAGHRPRHRSAARLLVGHHRQIKEPDLARSKFCKG